MKLMTTTGLFTRLTRHVLALGLVLGFAGTLATPAAAADEVRNALQELNRSRSVVGQNTSYQIVFDAILELSDPPIPLGPEFNHLTIHPGMDDWAAVSSWAESNPHAAEAILEAQGKPLFGLPYGRSNVDQKYRDADLVADIGVDGDLGQVKFPYLQQIDLLSAFACAEAYRRLEAGQVQEGYALMTAHLFLLRQCCDREFLAEQFFAIRLLGEALDNLRDLFWVYLDETPGDLYGDLAMRQLPFIQVDRTRLFMGEGDRIVAEGLLRQVFTEDGFPNPEKFVDTFSGLQAEAKPLTRFGAARRWRIIADLHDSLDASLERMTLVYDDWWRRWRVQEYDPDPRDPDAVSIGRIRGPSTRRSSIRPAGTSRTSSDARNVLIAQTWKARVRSASDLRLPPHRLGCVASHDIDRHLRRSPMRKTFEQATPSTYEFGPFKYDRVTSSRTPGDQIPTWGTAASEVGPDSAILWSKGQDQRGRPRRTSTPTTVHAWRHSCIWPPIKAVLREKGMMK